MIDLGPYVTHSAPYRRAFSRWLAGDALTPLDLRVLAAVPRCGGGLPIPASTDAARAVEALSIEVGRRGWDSLQPDLARLL